MIDRYSLRLRLTVAYGTCAFAVLITLGFFVAVASATIVARAETVAFEKTVRVVERDVSRAAPDEPLAFAQQRVMAQAASRGIGVIAIPPSISNERRDASYGLIDIGRFFNLSPKMIRIGDGALFVVPPARDRRRDAIAFGYLVGIVTLVAACGAWRFAMYAANATLRPLLTVTRELERFAIGDLAPRRLHLSQTSEFKRLAIAYNDAANTVTHAFVEQRSVEERIRQFVDDAGHELRTPLTVISGYVAVLRRERRVDASARRVALASIPFEIERMHALVENLATLARLDRGSERKPDAIDVTAIARNAIRSLSTIASAPVSLESAGSARVAGESADVYEAIGNLIDNALKYGAGSPVDVTISTDRGWVVVRVRDGGPGILEGDRERIFERFYRGRARPQAPGSGLGLAIASKAAERLGGRVALEESRAGSTTFSFVVPELDRDSQ